MTAIVLDRMGSFYAGGRRLHREGLPIQHIQVAPTLPDFAYDPNGTFGIEHCYVQYFVPADAVGLPWLLIHGGALTGALWETTPDGRPGWIEQLLRQRRAVYVADGMERGRSGFCALDGVWDGKPIMRSEEEAWWLFRFGMEADYAQRRPFPGQKFPVDALDGLLRQCVPRWTTTETLAAAAYREAVRKIGPCVVVTHSSGGHFGFDLAFSEPDLVRCVVSLEPSTFAETVPSSLDGQSFLTVMGDYLDRWQFWIDLDSRIQDWNRRLAGAGADARYLRLADVGLPGYSHMPMMDRDNDLPLAVIQQWVDERTPAR